MAAKTRKAPGTWFTVLLIVAAVAIWAYDESRPPDRDTGSSRGKTTENSRPSPSATESAGKVDDKGITPRVPGTSLDRPPGSISRSTTVEKAGAYEVYRDCSLAEARNNDGDSFIVTLPGGKKAEFRLYFVDTPESAFKSYANGEDNHRRIAEQARAFGDITPDQAVKTGQEAKHFTLELLAARPFTIYTRWDSPYSDERFHAFVQVTLNGKPRWLDELLVEKGYVRIHTKGAEMPDGTSYNSRREQLRTIEAKAKKAKAGAWGY